MNLGQGAAIQTGVEYARSQPGAAVFATFDADGQHRVKDVVRMIDRLHRPRTSTSSSAPASAAARTSDAALQAVVLFPLIAKLSPASRKLGLTDAHNGLRVFDRTVADALNITMNGMGHASEFIALIVENALAGGRRTRRDPLHRLLEVEGPAAGQRRQHRLRRTAARKDAPMNWIQVLLIASILALLVYLLRSRRSAQARAWVKVGYVLFVVAAIYAIVRPDDTTVVANWLGVDRGTDLLDTR